MKRTIRLLALILTLTLALSAAAMAKELDYTATNAQKNVHAASLVKDGCELKFDGDKLNVTYTNSALKEGDMVIVFLLETKDEDGKITEVKTEEAAKTLIVPTAENIKYIDQSVAKATAGNGSVSFSVYPQNYTNAVVRIISANVNAYVAAVKLDYRKGDANGNSKVDITDVVRVLRYIVDSASSTDGTFVRMAADMNGDGKIDITDAVAILQMLV